MKKQRLLIVILNLVLVFALVSPAVASEMHTPVGENIPQRQGYRVFPSNEPFNIQNGWIQTSEDGAIGNFDFRLEVDGVFVDNFYRDFSAVSGDPDTLYRIWVYNFPEGMTGTHTFTRHWYAPCQYAVDYLEYTGSCRTPNQKVETNIKILVVEFE